MLSSRDQGCQIFLGPNTPKPKQYTKRPQTIPKGIILYVLHGCKIFQMATKYNNIFYSNALKILPKLGFFGLKTNHLATLLEMMANHLTP
jgi:hypothetical protein